MKRYREQLIAGETLTIPDEETGYVSVWAPVNMADTTDVELVDEILDAMMLDDSQPILIAYPNGAWCVSTVDWEFPK